MNDQISRQKLKPCPFCGGEAVILAGFEEHIWIFCEECKAEISAHTTEEEAIEAWNKRAEPPAVGIDKQRLIDKLNSYHYTIIGMRCGKKVAAEIIKEYHDHVIEVIESQPPADQWIPCSSDRMPENGQTVVVTIKATDAYRFMVVLTYHETKPKCFTDNDWQGEGFYHYIWGDWIKRENVIAWKPSEPYKGE